LLYVPRNRGRSVDALKNHRINETESDHACAPMLLCSLHVMRRNKTVAAVMRRNKTVALFCDITILLSLLCGITKLLPL
jgi:hypothetical protein